MRQLSVRDDQGLTAVSDSAGDERWAPIPGYEGLYQVSDRGRFWSEDRLEDRGHYTLTRKGRFLKYSADEPRVRLSRDSVYTRFMVRTVVADVFGGAAATALQDVVWRPFLRWEGDRAELLCWGCSRRWWSDAIQKKCHGPDYCPDCAVQYRQDEREGPETWRRVVGCERYEVSDLGRVRAADRPDRPLSAAPDSGGYPSVHLYDATSSRSTRRVHVLVARAFIGGELPGQEVCHWDGDPTNNNVKNLRWDYRVGNMQDVIRHGRNHRAQRTRCPRDHRLVAPNLQADQLRRGRRSCASCAYAQTIRTTRKKRGQPPLDFKELADRKYLTLMKGAEDAQPAG